MPALCATARTLQVLAFASPSQMPSILPALAWPAKDPEDVLDYTLDLSPSLLPGEGIATVNLQVEPEGLGVAQPVLGLNLFADTLTTVRLLASEGLDATTYELAFLVATTQGRVLHVSATLPVAARAPTTIQNAGLTVSAPDPSGGLP